MSELYELPEGWEWKKFSDIVENHDKSRLPIKSSDRELIKGEFPYYGSTGIIDNLNKYIYEGEYLLISEDGANLTVRKYPIAFIATGKFWVNNHSHVVKAKKNISTNKFIEMYFVILDLKPYITGSAQPKLSQKKLNIIPIPLPPLQEQKRIVAKLDALFEKIDKVIALHQKNMDEATAFMGSVLNDVFGELEKSQKVPLKNITTKIGSGSTPRGGQKSYKTEGISLIRSMNVHDNGFRVKGLAFIDDEQAKKLDNVSVQENDVLLNITGASVARCCIVDKNYLPARVNQHVSILRVKDEMISSFLHYYLISPSVKSELLFSSSGGATREAITKSMLEEFQVPLISLIEQEKIVTYVDDISYKIKKIKQVQKEKMQSLVALKASILDKAFRGEL